MFKGCSKITSASNIVIPKDIAGGSTNGVGACRAMFQGCAQLIDPPKI